MGRRFLLIGLVSVFILSLWPAGSKAATEHILDFTSSVVVRPDASLLVTETIKVMALGREIKRGIIREFPTTYPGRFGGTMRVGFKVQKILRDGRTEPYHTKGISNGVAIYIGSKNVFLKPGEYTYTIVYETDGQLGYFKDYDELYWNVTGNGWTFAIDRARAVITLPPGARVLDLAGYTGPQGAKGKNFTVDKSAGSIVFTTIKPLPPGEGLTVSVSWPKGMVTEPGALETALKHYRPALVGLAGLTMVFFYYLVFWFKAGRDPEKGTIIPLFEPPSKMSPAAVRFVSQMGFDKKAASVALVDMAVKKYLTIEEDDGEYTLKRTGKIDSGLSVGEKKLAKNIFVGTDSIALKKENHRRISKGMGQFKEALKTEYGKNYFLLNRGYFFGGLMLSLAVMGAMVLSSSDLSTGGFISLWLSMWTFGVTALAIIVVKAWRNALGGRVRKRDLLAPFLFTLFALPFFIGEIVGLAILSSVISFQGIIVAAVLAFLNILFFNLLKAPTRGGRELLDKIDGFKKFLTVAEKDRINLLNPPEETPELFEKFLPYAMALDVEVQWGKRFAAVLASASIGDTAYSPHWYTGRNWSLDNMAGFTSDLGGSFSSAVSSASTAPGSSSGSSGGGSSGGGGGGGGGRGW